MWLSKNNGWARRTVSNEVDLWFDPKMDFSFVGLLSFRGGGVDLDRGGGQWPGGGADSRPFTRRRRHPPGLQPLTFLPHGDQASA